MQYRPECPKIWGYFRFVLRLLKIGGFIMGDFAAAPPARSSLPSAPAESRGVPIETETTDGESQRRQFSLGDFPEHHTIAGTHEHGEF